MKDYSDIIDLPHPEPRNHGRMPRAKRAAQFSPFSALTGLSKAMEETARLTEEKPELDEMEIEKLNARLQLVRERMAEAPEVNLKYFVKDAKKSGGAIVTAECRIRKIDTVRGVLLLSTGTEVRINDIIDLSGDIFDSLEYY